MSDQMTAAAEVGTTASGRDYSKRTAWHMICQLIAPYKGMAIATLLLLLCDIVGMLYVPTELSAMVNTAITTHDTSQAASHGVAMLVASIVGSGGCIASYYLASRLAAKVGRDMRMAIYEHSLTFSGSDFSSFGTGSMITRTLSDANVVQQTLLMSFLMLAPAPVTCIVSVVLAFRIDATMGRMLLAISAVIIVISVVAVMHSAPIFLKLQGFIDRMNVRLRESITGVRVIRAFGKERYERDRLDETFKEYADNAIRVNFVFAVTDSLTFFMMNIAEFAIMWLGADRVGAHAMQIGSISALVEYAISILFFMMMAQFAILMLPRAFACLTRAAQVLDIDPSIKDPAHPEALPTAPSQGRVARFDKVSFRFADADEDTLHDLDFEIRSGEVCAIIGNTGSGKSTIAKLLLRFHDVTDGSLSFDGVDVRNLSQKDLRSHIAYVPQTAWLFSGTIASNLRQGCPDATDEELWHALDVAQAAFVRELPDGLDSHVAQGGSNFSGGQRQRLAIARALVRHADLYVFDDSFSALDYKTDADLRHALADELSGAAQLIIAQRVSTIRDAAQIVVLRDGAIVGKGTHDELMQDCPVYQEIERSQTRGGE